MNSSNNNNKLINFYGIEAVAVGEDTAASRRSSHKCYVCGTSPVEYISESCRPCAAEREQTVIRSSNRTVLVLGLLLAVTVFGMIAAAVGGAGAKQ